MKNSAGKIKIYTDGAARGNPGPAGWAVIILYLQNDSKLKVESYKVDQVIELGGRSDHATNNQMELTGAIEALKYILKVDCVRQGLTQLEIFSDSKYVILGITKWIFNWQKNNWKNAAKKPVLNKELWQDLYELAKDLKIKWHYVEGHSGDKWNERADEIATSFADNMAIDLRKDK